MGLHRGSSSTTGGYRQIGNAVPPNLGQAVARSVHDALCRHDGSALEAVAA